MEDARLLFEEAAALQRAGDARRAGQLARQSLALAPRAAAPRLLLGVLDIQAGRFDAAADQFRRASEVEPGNASAHANLGEALRRAGDLAGAEAACRRATVIAPDFPEGHANLGLVLRALGRPLEAVAAFERATALKPNHARAHYNLGNAYLDVGRVRSALERFREAARLAPGWAAAHNNLGVALDEWDEADEALVHYREAARLDPADAGAHRNVAQAMEKRSDLSGARAAWAHVDAVSPADPLRRLHAETLCPVVPSSVAEIDEARARIDAALGRAETAGPFALDELPLSGGEPPSLLTYQGRDNQALKTRWAGLFTPGVPTFEPFPVERPPHVGFVVTRGHEGVFLKGMRGIIERLPAHGIRVTVVCSGTVGEQVVRAAITAPGVAFLRLPPGIAYAAEAVRAARFSVLHYWEVGTDATNYALPFFRLAPVQATSWGWPDTSGIPNLDTFLSGGALDRAGAEADYTERLVRLDHLPTYYFRPPVPAPVTREQFGLPARGGLYLCAQNLRKVHPDMDALFAGVLRADPSGHVVLIDDKLPAVTDRLRRRLDAAMPDVAARIRFLPRMPEVDYLALTALADVALDTVHYGGGANTVYDAYAAGTPVVSLPGPHHRTRWALAAARQCGLDDLGIAASPDEYIRLAIEVGTDRDRRDALGHQMREASDALFEDTATVTDLAGFVMSAER
jgi:predicted O-linked N-acetylglucosamine transferase (SPINDLY family)